MGTKKIEYLFCQSCFTQTVMTPQLSDMTSVDNITSKTRMLHTAVRIFYKYSYVSVVIEIQYIFYSNRNLNMVQVLTFHLLVKTSSSSILGQIFKGILVGAEYPSLWVFKAHSMCLSRN